MSLLVGLMASGGCGGAALQEQGVTAVTNTHWLRVGGQGQLIAGAGIAENVATVSAVVLGDRKKAVKTIGEMQPTPTLLCEAWLL